MPSFSSALQSGSLSVTRHTGISVRDSHITSVRWLALCIFSLAAGREKSAHHSRVVDTTGSEQDASAPATC